VACEHTGRVVGDDERDRRALAQRISDVAVVVDHAAEVEVLRAVSGPRSGLGTGGGGVKVVPPPFPCLLHYRADGAVQCLEERGHLEHVENLHSDVGHTAPIDSARTVW
jgi:hypothetical protein